jgi:hypothetical protein
MHTQIGSKLEPPGRFVVSTPSPNNFDYPTGRRDDEKVIGLRFRHKEALLTMAGSPERT